ncbi:hypothetical protein H5V45_13200 [Nocardioides sp. KIGAM211]|uniref:Uncharacterized protein n=1 Tax=Nocardioides luti TaxID=2761101 RepID=A0A7X0RH79_9ACTN|nr:hypothetical protein [Nocardioides luti]MBB6628278.1 hypothetical protein [Nocardioides luti]
MTDPEIAYQRIVSGDAGAVHAAADTLGQVRRDLDGAGDAIYQATGVPVWTGQGATAFQGRAAGLLQGVQVNHVVVARARGALETAAKAYDAATQNADHFISFWRNRPGGLPPFIEELLALVVNVRLLEVETSYDHALAAIAGVLTGEESVDLDELDEDTRKWVEHGLDRNEDWLEGNGSGLGPIIPYVAATGDDRGWIPQGLGYDPASGLLLQSYYNHHGDPATMALIDPTSGHPMGDVALGGYTDNGRPTDYGTPGHAGGVAVDGDNVYVTSEGQVYTYSLNDMQNASSGDEVPQVAPPQELAASSYSTIKDGQLYVGDFDSNTMYAYNKGPDGQWQPVVGSNGQPLPIPTPDNVQGVLVRDGEFVFSTSSGRGNESQLIVQDRNSGDRSDPYTMPNMSEGVVEVNGNLITTYESGAAEYDHWDGKLGWLWGVKDSDSLWANPYMTSTPLGELGLSGEFEAEPKSLRKAAAELGDPAATLGSASSTLAGVHVTAVSLGRVPSASTLATAVDDLVSGSADSVRTGAAAAHRLAEALLATGHHYEATDSAVSGLMQRLGPW